jgi:hypothetical protein
MHSHQAWRGFHVLCVGARLSMVLSSRFNRFSQTSTIYDLTLTHSLTSHPLAHSITHGPVEDHSITH